MRSNANNGTLESYVARMRELTRSVAARNARIHARTGTTATTTPKSAAAQRREKARA
jgi:hypothetical protein